MSVSVAACVLSLALLAETFFLGWAATGALAGRMQQAPTFTVQLAAQAVDAQIQELYAALQQAPEVQSIDYVTKEQAYEAERRRNADLTAFLEGYDVSNPFPETFLVTLRSLGDRAALVAMLSEAQWRSAVDAGSFALLDEQTGELQSTLSLLRTARLALLALCLTALGGLLALSGGRAWSRAAGSDALLLGWSVGASPTMLLIGIIMEELMLLLPAFLVGAAVIAALLLPAVGMQTLISVLPLPSPAIAFALLSLLTLFAALMLALSVAWMLWLLQGRLLRRCALS